MKKSNQLALGFAVGFAVVACGIVSYKLATDVELRDSVDKAFREFARGSRQKVEEVGEEVALKTAQMTNNPKITQDWIEKQWDVATS